MTRADLEYFISLTGDNMDIISTEFEKLMCYTDGRDVVIRKDMDEICTRQIEDKIFDMIEDYDSASDKGSIKPFHRSA